MKTEQYLAVSALSYKNLEAYVGYTIGKLYSPDGPLDNDFMNKIENKALKGLSSWVQPSSQQPKRTICRCFSEPRNQGISIYIPWN